MIKKYKHFRESHGDDHMKFTRHQFYELVFPEAIRSHSYRRHVDTKFKQNDDFSFDVFTNVEISNMGLEEIPIKFGRVDGDFNCQNNQLKSLVNSPDIVGGNFDCSNNKLTTLKHSPSRVEGSFYTNNNKLTTLEGCEEIDIRGNFYVGGNKLTSLVGSPITFAGQNFDFQCNDIRDMKGFPQLHTPDFNIFHYGNPVTEILNLLDHPNEIQSIEHLNEWEVINVQDMTVSYLRLKEVYLALNLFMQSFEDLQPYFSLYTLID